MKCIFNYLLDATFFSAYSTFIVLQSNRGIYVEMMVSFILDDYLLLSKKVIISKEQKSLLFFKLS